eukprot:g61102.t1
MGAPRSRPMGRWDRESLWDRSKCVPHARPLNRAPWDVWASRRVFHVIRVRCGRCFSGGGSVIGYFFLRWFVLLCHVSGGSPVGSSTSSVAFTSVGLHVLFDSAFRPRVFRSALADSFHAATGVAEVNRAVEDLDEAAESWLAWRSKRWVKSSIHVGERWKQILCCRIARRSLSRSPLGWFLLVGRLLG